MNTKSSRVSHFPQLHVEAQGLVYDATSAPDTERIAYMTSLVPMQSGTYLAGWQCGAEKHTPLNTIRLARSNDGAETWELLSYRFETTWQGIPGSLLTAEMVEAEPGRLLIFTTWVDRSDPERPLFNPETEGILPTRILFCESVDEGDHWSAWTEIDTGSLTGCAITGPIVRWSDGSIACTFESFKEFDDPTPAEPAAWLVLSTNAGRSFGEPWRIAKHPHNESYYWDQRLCSTNNPGEFIDMFWTHNRLQQRDLNVHFLKASIHEGSKAANAPVETTIPGQIAACAVADDGRLLSFVVNRDRPGTMTLWQSNDDGGSWPEEAKLIVHTHDERAKLSQGREDIDYAEYWEDMQKWSFGHPAIRKIEGDWLLAWYAGTPDCMSIHWARVVEGGA